MEANGRVITRETLLERIWGHQQSANIESRTLDVHMSRLRRKLGRSARNIVTVRSGLPYFGLSGVKVNIEQVMPPQ